ncbi:protein-tyrosine phosphatase-like protein [Thelephora terrestris]|uniref:protein-tyrosine-phosphatase n=1 Tax=Thelephora terrestris TaxID=56493 RepID=A0A9P6H8P3_9AGAM|nr:protein-tyrosine phosphatase-like protein [Thelephora terrestris]
MVTVSVLKLSDSVARPGCLVKGRCCSLQRSPLDSSPCIPSPIPPETMTIPPINDLNPVIDGRLYIGSLQVALSSSQRSALGITHVLSVCPEYPAEPEDVHHLCIPVQDSEFENLLVQLPAACSFIQNAIDGGGKVLVHCVMGVSRSATVICAYLMMTRQLSVEKALGYLRDRRPQVHPNYGFLKQLHAFAACNYKPAPCNSAYRTWKRRQAQDVNHFLNIMSDTTLVIPDQLMMSSDFTEDPEEAQWLLHDMGVSHVVSASSSLLQIAKELESFATCRYFDIPDDNIDALTVVLRRICDFLHTAIRNGGRVLVYCSCESRASVIVCAYLMFSQRISATAATNILHTVLPFFEPSQSLRRQLQLFESCQCNPRPRSSSVKGTNSVSFTSPLKKDTPPTSPPFGNTLNPVTTSIA